MEPKAAGFSSYSGLGPDWGIRHHRAGPHLGMCLDSQMVPQGWEGGCESATLAGLRPAALGLQSKGGPLPLLQDVPSVLPSGKEE